MAQTKPVTKKETPLDKGVVTDIAIEKPVIPESTPNFEIQKVPEGQETVVEQAQEKPAEEPVVKKTAVLSVPAKPQKDRIEKEIEAVLEEDLKEMYTEMSPLDKQKFKAKGEEITSKIKEIVNSAKVNAKKIFHLIRSWLKMIPGVSKFYLEQEAKIKTDKIILVTEKEKADQKNNDL